MVSDYFQILGVARNATAQEIKHAYFRKIKEHPPERDAEGFKRIREAYEALSDAAAKKAYEALLDHGGEIQQLLGKVKEHWERAEWGPAVNLLKRILVLNPEEDGARGLLAAAFNHQEEYGQALHHLERLIARHPEAPAFYLNHGRVLLEKAGGERVEPEDRDLLLKRAREDFQKAIDLEPDGAAGYLDMATSYQGIQEYELASRWCERAIQLDGVLDFQDFEVLVRICIIRILQQNRPAVEETLRRIESVIQGPEMGEFVAFRLAALAHQLVEVLSTDFARLLLRSARKLDAGNEDLKQFAESVENVSQAKKEVEEAQRDPLVLPPLRRMMALALMGMVGNKEKDLETEWKACLQALGSYQPQTLLSSLDRTLATYRIFYSLQRQPLASLRAGARQAVEAAASARWKMWGCLVVAVVVILMIIIFGALNHRATQQSLRSNRR